jgi:hypothetical protein
MQHASGFPNTLEGQQTPMRVMRILDGIKTQKKSSNFLIIIQEMSGVIRKEQSTINIWHENELILQTLYYIPAFSDFKEIFIPTIWHLSDLRQKKEREKCQCLMG